MHQAQASGGLGQCYHTALVLLSAVLVPRPWQVPLAALVLREQRLLIWATADPFQWHLTLPSPIKAHWAVLTSSLHLPASRGSKFSSAEEP